MSKRKKGRGQQPGGYRSSRERERRLAQASAAPQPTTETAPDDDNVGVDAFATSDADAPVFDEPAGTETTAFEPTTTAPRRVTRGARAEAPERPRGILSGLRGDSPYPPLRQTFGRAIAVVASSPVLVLLPLLVVFLLWVALLASGLDHVPRGMVDLLAIPPLGSLFDLTVALTIGGNGTTGLLLVGAFTLVRGVVWAVLVSLVVERLEYGRVSVYGLLRGLRAAPVVVLLLLLNIAVFLVGQTLAGFLGPSLGNVVFMAALVGGLYLLVFAPVAAIRRLTAPREAIRRSIAAARLPGGRHAGMTILYFAFGFFAFAPGGAAFFINPSVSFWVYILAATLLHVVVLAGYAYRFMAIESELPEAATGRRRGTERRVRRPSAAR